MTWKHSWAPWLKDQLEKKGFPTEFGTFPDSILARSEYWLPFLHDFLKAGKNDVLVGWSSGAVAAMRYAEQYKIRGSALVSPSYTDLGDAMEKKSGYFNKTWNWKKIKANQKKIALVHADNDPYIPAEQFEFIARQLKPYELIVPGGKHFIEFNEFPQILDYLLQNY